MSIWTRIGEILGSFSQRTGVAGSLANALDPDRWLPGGQDAAFTIALVALLAKMAGADGVVSHPEERAFFRMISVDEAGRRQVERLFNLAQQDISGFDAYARKIGRMFANSPQTLEHVLDGLFFIATADGLIHEDEYAYLKSVSDIFGFDDARFEQIVAQHVVEKSDQDPYLVLGLSPDADDDEVKRVYRRLVREHHPDRLIAKGVPEEMVGIATGRMASINSAYQAIAKARGF